MSAYRGYIHASERKWIQDKHTIKTTTARRAIETHNMYHIRLKLKH